MYSVSGSISAGEVSFLANQETFKVNHSKRALLITKPEKMFYIKM